MAKCSDQPRHGTAQTVSTPVESNDREIRPHENQSFVQGYPGIPASDTRPDAHLSGTIAVHVPSSKGVEATWLRVEMCKIETLPRGQTWKELIGEGPIDVWKAGEVPNEWNILTSVGIMNTVGADHHSKRSRFESRCQRSYRLRFVLTKQVASNTNLLRR